MRAVVKGYDINVIYQGINTYIVEKDGEQVYFGWDWGDVLRITGVTWDEFYDAYIEKRKETV